MNKLRIFILVLCLLFSLIFSACAPNVVITQDLAIVQSNDFSLSGNIDYEGNADYLPRTVSVESHPGATLTLRYRYEVTYGRDAVLTASFRVRRPYFCSDGDCVCAITDVSGEPPFTGPGCCS